MADYFKFDHRSDVGFDILAKKMEALSRGVPVKVIDQAVKAATRDALVEIRARAPIDTGKLRDGLIPRKERSQVPGKIVYDVMMDPAKNRIFQKPISKPIRSRDGHAYYPASMEYGFFVRGAGTSMVYMSPKMARRYIKSPAYGKSYFKGVKVPGKYFMRRGATATEEAVSKEIIRTMEKEIDKLWK